MDEWIWEMRKLEESKIIYDVKQIAGGNVVSLRKRAYWEGELAGLCAPPPSLGCKEDGFRSLLLYVES